MQCEPWTVRPSVRVTVTVSPSRVTEAIRERASTCHPAPGEHLLQHRRGVGVLAREHPVAAGDQGDLDAEREVGAGELRAR